MCICVHAGGFHEAACPYVYDAALWSSDRAWIVAGLGGLAGELTATNERMGHGVIAYVVDPVHDGALPLPPPAWWGDRAGRPTILHTPTFLRLWAAHYAKARFVIGIGDPATRHRFAQALAACRTGFAIDPSATMMTGASVGEGAVVSAGTVVSHGTMVSDHAYVNYHVTLGHDVYVGDCAVVCPGAQLMGGVQLGERVFIGTGAIVLPRVTIGDDAIIGAGAIVLRDVLPSTTVVGNPARVIERT